MNNHIERAVKVIGRYHTGSWLGRDTDAAIAQALADAGLLITPEQQAVLDAAEHWHHVRRELDWEADGWIDAVADADAGLDEAVIDALRASKDTP